MRYLKCLRSLKSMVDMQSAHKLKVLKTNGRGECVSKGFERLCEKEGSVHEVVPAYTPQQNGVSERKNRSIITMVRSMLKGEN